MQIQSGRTVPLNSIWLSGPAGKINDYISVGISSLFPLFGYDLRESQLVKENFLRFHVLYTEKENKDFGVNFPGFETSFFIDQSTCPGLQTLQGIEK
jgi:hypothetical protein